jgi:transposase
VLSLRAPAENRKSQAVFCCLACAHCGQADVNAAVNIRNRGLKQHPQGRTAGAAEPETTVSNACRHGDRKRAARATRTVASPAAD